MAHRQLTQVGFNRVMWRMLAALGGKFTVTNADVNSVNQAVGIHITHSEKRDEFTLRLKKIPKPAAPSLIIQPGMN